jgi:hypothetical protein
LALDVIAELLHKKCFCVVKKARKDSRVPKE